MPSIAPFMHIITDPSFYFVAVPVVLLAGMSKGGLGPAVTAIAVPALSFVINPIQAAAVLLPILCVMDLLAVVKFRRSFSVYHLTFLLPAGVAGIVLATWLLGKVSADTIKTTIGATVIWFCLDYWLRGEHVREEMGGKLGGFFWGALAGFTSTQIHAGAAPVSIYLLPQRLDKRVFMGTMAIFFAIMNGVKLVPYSAMGFLHVENLMTSLLLMPLAPVGIGLGGLIVEKVEQKVIYRFLYIALFLSGVKLLSDGFM